jgi:hypothetical protein
MIDSAKTGRHEPVTETGEFSFEPPSRRQSACSFVRQLRDPHPGRGQDAKVD